MTHFNPSSTQRLQGRKNMRKPQPRTLLGHVGRQFLRAANNADTRDSKQVSLLYSHLKVVAQLEDRIASASLKQYRAKAAQMSPKELSNEKGKSSTLRRNMKHGGITTPRSCSNKRGCRVPTKINAISNGNRLSSIIYY